MANILLVEDEQLIQDMYHLALKRKGHTVDVAEDGEKALAKLLVPNPVYDLVLLDVMLPKLDGISILRKIKQPDSSAKSIPVFLLTNLGLDDVMNEARSLGAIKCIIKSSTLPEQIIAEIDQFFAGGAVASATSVQPVPEVSAESQPVFATPAPVPNPTPVQPVSAPAPVEAVPAPVATEPEMLTTPVLTSAPEPVPPVPYQAPTPSAPATQSPVQPVDPRTIPPIDPA